MFEIAVIAFTTFFATIAPLDSLAVFVALTHRSRPETRRAMAIKGTAIATGLLLFFCLLGGDMLKWLGITLPAMRTAGGLLLFLISVDMVFARQSGGTSTTEGEMEEAEGKVDISVFPLASPLLAGPGAMGAAVLLYAQANGDFLRELAVVGALLVVMAVTLTLLLSAGAVQRMLGVTGMNVSPASSASCWPLCRCSSSSTASAAAVYWEADVRR